MSTVIEDSSAVAVDHDAHVTQLDFVDKIPDGDHAVVHVAEPTSPVPQSTPPEPALPSTPFTNNSLPEEAYQQRRARHRSTIETRSSNRLSGFFTNLIHRRDSPITQVIREDPSQPDTRSKSEAASRASSPHPGRPVTPPPPPLPPPTLKELGLSLSAITSSLSPSHFSTPPSSGAFLSPHYLLLCHAQGLDVLPLVSPPALQPYALIRRVSFKNVVVMEQRGVLVAIAGRRDGIRVYALQEVKRVIEWRIDAEIKRERDKLRRESVKKVSTRVNDSHDFSDKFRKASLSTPPPGEPDYVRANLLRKNSHNPLPVPVLPPPVPLIPRSATPRTPRKRKNPPKETTPGPSGSPPPYTPSESNAPPLQSRPSYISLRSRGAPISDVFNSPDESRAQDIRKAEWAESSDDEAIDVVAAGSSGSHLDERTSATLSSNRALTSPPMQPIVAQAEISTVRHSTAPVTRRRRRPSNLDLSTRPNTIPAPEHSPVSTLLTLRQALSQPRSATDPETPFMEVDDEEEDAEGISLAQALLESRIPDLPPIGTRHPQEPILITPSPVSRSATTEPSLSRTADGHGSIDRSNTNGNLRRRWSIMISSPTSETRHDTLTPTRPSTASSSFSDQYSRSRSFQSQTPTSRSFTDPPTTPHEVPSLPDLSLIPPTSRSSRFFPRIINVLHGRRTDEHLLVPSQSLVESGEGSRWTNSTSQTPPPKLEYVKLPGTKGAFLIKAVETAKKSFLAILCGENGEKVELFAGTYRTALGLSRTFILPDSPRSLELQLQGDDLVEVFLVFAQNVFGLEPATVRVREVRIGRAERRAARRRARENRGGDALTNDPDNLEEETNVNVSIGVTMPVASGTAHDSERSNSPTVANDHPESQTDPPRTPVDLAPSSSAGQAEELAALATAQMGPYTTFQQLAFAPKFPLASIADDYIIPPTYPSFLEYKGTHEPKSDENQTDFAQTQFSPPGLPLPTPTAPSKWFYRDPKNNVHGPWKASLMQAWYKDGLLPPDLPVRREEDTEYMLLKELRLQSVDPTQPFRVISPLVIPPPIVSESSLDKPLLSPISLLEQPRHFGPPALFFSSRGGHSTSIVDSRGRSVLKGKFFWSSDNSEETKSSFGKMGDIKRLEALDVSKRAVLVAMRQGGLEVVDIGDALLKPADESRTTLPHYNPPQTNINRRAPFVWKIGTSIVNTQLNELMSEKQRMHNQMHSKKVSVGSKQNSSGRPDPTSGDFDTNPQDEVLFLGRKEDEIYFCEKTAVSFRILRLSTTDHDTL